jgi:uncharacterized membrane protein (TIGR02234 family)
MAERRGYAAVVGVGVAAAVLAAVAGHQPWAHGSAPGGLGELSATVEAGKVPAANALSLVVLACWGVLLVTRGMARRVVSVVALLAAGGLAAAVVVGFSTAPDHVRDAYHDLGVDHPTAGLGGWYWVTAVATLLVLATTGAAVRLVPGWPEMGRRYDAPTGGSPGSQKVPGTTPEKVPEKVPEEQENLDLWKAMDQGHDPTV